jgi:hypothetical protein
LTQKNIQNLNLYRRFDITLWNQFSIEQSTALSKIGMSIINSLMILLEIEACPILKLEQIDTKQKEKLQILIPLRDALAYLLEKV